MCNITQVFFGLPRIHLEGKLQCIFHDFHQFDNTRKVQIFALDFDASLHHACFFRLLIIYLEGKLQCIFIDFHQFDIKREVLIFALDFFYNSGEVALGFESIMPWLEWFLSMLEELISWSGSLVDRIPSITYTA